MVRLRFFKKLSGEKVLQQYNPATDEFSDVPMTEEVKPTESGKDRLLKAVRSMEIKRSSPFTILISDRFHEILKLEHNGLYVPWIDDITCIYGHRVYVVKTMLSDFKFVKEL